MSPGRTREALPDTSHPDHVVDDERSALDDDDLTSDDCYLGSGRVASRLDTPPTRPESSGSCTDDSKSVSPLELVPETVCDPSNSIEIGGALGFRSFPEQYVEFVSPQLSDELEQEELQAVVIPPLKIKTLASHHVSPDGSFVLSERVISYEEPRKKSSARRTEYLRLPRISKGSTVQFKGKPAKKDCFEGFLTPRGLVERSRQQKKASKHYENVITSSRLYEEAKKIFDARSFRQSPPRVLGSLQQRHLQLPRGSRPIATKRHPKGTSSKYGNTNRKHVSLHLRSLAL